MNLRALRISIGTTPVGVLFQYGEGSTAITRLLPDESYWRDANAPVLSWAATVPNAEARETFWRTPATQPFFNGVGTVLPTFFQNLLPEGPLRRHLEQIRKSAPGDHFDLLAMCGTDLPGNVFAEPIEPDREQIAGIVTQHNDALEMTVTADPVAGATSLSGVQPKLALVANGGRYVARTKDARGTHIIAKLPTVEYPLLPEVEALSAQLAQAAGVDVCRAWLAPLSDIAAEQPFVLGESSNFLAVERFDRTDTTHIHCEDFAQILSILPEAKYTHPNATYATMARVMRQSQMLGDEAVDEFVRRLIVNEMLGNYDAHVKNYGVIYRDGKTPELSPAYDVVAYAAYLPGRGHALKLSPDAPDRAQFTPHTLRMFCNSAGIGEVRARKVITQAVQRALETWPALIESSALLAEQKKRLVGHFQAVPMVESMLRRKRK